MGRNRLKESHSILFHMTQPQPATLVYFWANKASSTLYIFFERHLQRHAREYTMRGRQQSLVKGVPKKLIALPLPEHILTRV